MLLKNGGVTRGDGLIPTTMGLFKKLHEKGHFPRLGMSTVSVLVAQFGTIISV